MWKVLLVYLLYLLGASSAANVKCHGCYYQEGINSFTQMLVDLLIQVGTDTRDQTTEFCQHGFDGFPAWTNESANAMKELDCDGKCTARFFNATNVGARVWQRTCMSLAVLANTSCVEYYDEEPTDVASHGGAALGLKTTSTCCTSEKCNTRANQDVFSGAPSTVASFSLVVVLTVAYCFIRPGNRYNLL